MGIGGGWNRADGINSAFVRVIVIMGKRIYICKLCSKDWQVSILKTVPEDKYICPRCTRKRRSKKVCFASVNQYQCR